MKYNIGIYSFIPTFISYIVCLIIFIKVDFNIIKEKIKDLLWAKENLKYIKNKKENIIEKKVEKVEKIIEYEKPKIIKEYNYLEPIFISIAKEKDYELSDVLFGQLNALKIKNAKRMKRNILMNLKSNSSSDSKTNEFTKSESKLNINNDIVITKKNEKHSPPKKMQIDSNNKIINEKQPPEKNNIEIKIEVPNSNKKEKKLSEQEIKRIKEILA